MPPEPIVGIAIPPPPRPLPLQKTVPTAPLNRQQLFKILSTNRHENLVQHNKKQYRKVLLSSFHLNGHTLGFHPQTQKLEPPCTA